MEILIELKNFQYLTMGLSWQCVSWYMNVYKRGAVGSDCTGSIVTLPVNNDVVEEDCLAIEGKTLGYNGMVRATVNRHVWKPEA